MYNYRWRSCRDNACHRRLRRRASLQERLSTMTLRCENRWRQMRPGARLSGRRRRGRSGQSRRQFAAGPPRLPVRWPDYRRSATSSSDQIQVKWGMPCHLPSTRLRHLPSSRRSFREAHWMDHDIRNDSLDHGYAKVCIDSLVEQALGSSTAVDQLECGACSNQAHEVTESDKACIELLRHDMPLVQVLNLD